MTHDLFASLRLRGEWFRQDATLLNYIAEHAHPLPPAPPRKRPRKSRAEGPGPEEYRRNLSAALAGRLPDRKARISLARRLGVTVDTIDNWIAGVSGPDAYNLVQLVTIYGRDFFNAIGPQFGVLAVVA